MSLLGRNRFGALGGLLLAGLVSSLALIRPALAQASAVVRVDPPTTAIATYQIATVSIRIDNVTNLGSAEIHLAFDPNVLEVIDADPAQAGIQITNGGMLIADFVGQNTADNTLGTIDFSVAQIARPGVAGSGTLAVISFTGKAPGISPVTFRGTQWSPTGVNLSDPNGIPIAHTMQSGSVTVSGLPTTPTFTPALSPTTSGPTFTPTPTLPGPTPTPTSTSPGNTPTPSPTATPSLPTCVPRLSWIIYIVQYGNTLASIAQATGTTILELKLANCLDTDLIYAGQLLLVPRLPYPTPTLMPGVSPTPQTSPTPTPNPSAPPIPTASTGRLEITYPPEMVVGKDEVVTVEIVIDPSFIQLESLPLFATGVIAIEGISQDGSRRRIEDTIPLYRAMSVQLITAGFEIIEGPNDPLKAIIPTIRSPFWTWSIRAREPGVHTITINVFGEVTHNETPTLIPITSKTWNVNVVDELLANRIVDGLLDNVPAIIGTGGPLGLLIAYLTYRMNQENKKQKKRIAVQGKTITGLEVRVKELEAQSRQAAQPSHEKRRKSK